MPLSPWKLTVIITSGVIGTAVSTNIVAALVLGAGLGISIVTLRPYIVQPS